MSILPCRNFMFAKDLSGIVREIILVGSCQAFWGMSNEEGQSQSLVSGRPFSELKERK